MFTPPKCVQAIASSSAVSTPASPVWSSATNAHEVQETTDFTRTFTRSSANMPVIQLGHAIPRQFVTCRQPHYYIGPHLLTQTFEEPCGT